MFADFTVFSWVLFVISALCLILAGATLKIRYQSVTIWFIGLLLAYAIQAFGYAFELTSHELDSIKFWLNIEFVGACFIPTCVVLFAVSYQTRTSPPLWLVSSLLSISAIVLLGQLTNDLHGLGFNIVGLEKVDNITVTTNHLGWLYLAYSLYIHLAVIVSVIIFIRCMQNTHPVLRPQILLILVGITLTWLNYIWTLFGNTPYGLDIGTFGFIFCTIAFAISVFRYDLIKLTPIARDQIFHQVEQGYIVIDEQSRLIDYNPKAKVFLPALSTGKIGQPLSSFIDPSLVADNQTKVIRLNDGKRVQVQRSLMGKNAAMAIGSVIMLSDVTEKEQLLEEMERIANTDSLTGCHNRHALHCRLKQQIIESRHQLTPLSIVVLDIVGFRKVNEVHGYTVGDMRLKQLSHILSHHLPSDAILTRYIGDIFIIILPGYRLEDANQLALQLADKAKQLTSLAISTFCVQHLSEESDRQVIDRLLGEAMQLKKLKPSLAV
ncbi:histidine kinase N-terminal 7TM domain-containing diguanylate cyclase [Shewanella xiamenensis]|uniref:histidine kinase N-terminal 7TM domain-containing diguanylate cyclase n=1 Tax=Shewanella xiamenensis TaxID=332186 RepID=UPI0035B9ECDE